jgi:hypothetical protein
MPLSGHRKSSRFAALRASLINVIAWTRTPSRQAGRADLTFALAIAIAGVLTVGAALACLIQPRLTAQLPTTGMTVQSGFAYMTPIVRPPFGYRIIGDSSGNASVSNLRLFEDGKAIGPAHSRHADISENGRGRYSHWGAMLRFAASDSSDPRSNGKSYSIAVTASVHPLAVTAVALFDLVVLLLAWPWLKSRPLLQDRLAGGAMLISFGLVVLLAIGAFGSVNEGTAPPKDVSLAVSTFLHAVLGCAILGAQWLAGAGLARLALTRGPAALSDVALLGFALGLPVSAVAAVVALVVPFGAVLAAALWLLCCAPLLTLRAEVRDIAALAKAAACVLPLAVGFGCWMGFLWHGPTDTLPGAPTGDLVYYSTSIVSLSRQFYPYLNLGYEPEPLNFYFNSLFPLVGAALSRVVTFDPFLFIAAGGSAFFVLALALALHSYFAGEHIRGGNSQDLLSRLILMVGVISAARYPYWVAESIPVIHAVPLTVCVVYWARKKEMSARLLGLVLAVVGSALSKVVSISVLAPLAAGYAAPLFFQINARLRVLIAAGIAVVAAYALILLYSLGSLNFAIAALGPESLNKARIHDPGFWALAPYVMRDVSALLLAFVAFLFADRLVALAIALGFLLFLIYPFLFHIDFVCATIALSLIACDRSNGSWQSRSVLLGALLLSIPAILLIDPAGTSSGVVWVFCIGGAVWLAMPREGRLAWRAPVRSATLAAALLCLGLVSVARGHLILTSGWQPGVLTPSVRQIWLAVKELTPPDALIFTDQTGIEATLLGSWNTYAFIGARQIFVSNLYMNATTRLDRKLSLDILRENEAILAGRLLPAQLALRGRYSSYYAVLSLGRPVPSEWFRVFENDRYVLYRIPQGSQ